MDTSTRSPAPLMTDHSHRPANGREPVWVRHLSRRLQFAIDLAVLIGAFVLAYMLRFDFSVPAKQIELALIQLPMVALIQLAAILITGIYTFVWRYIGLAEVQAFVRAALYSATPLLLLRLGLPDRFKEWRVPLSIIVMDTVLVTGGLLAIRVLRRMLFERYERRRTRKTTGSDDRRGVLLVGAGRFGVMAAREIQSRGDMNLAVMGFVDDDPQKQGSVIQGIKVLGTTAELPQLVAKHGIQQVVLTIVEASRQELRRIVEICERIPVEMQIIPGLYEILQGKVSISRIRKVEIEDLLGREPIHLDEESLAAFLTGKSIMVTGAGGSIGSELARQVARFYPERLLLVERAEFALFDIHRELREHAPDLELVPLVADVGDRPRMATILTAEKPQVILHAAAHKHVPLMERNPEDAIKNNVLATRLLGDLAGENGVETFVLISSDKAVRPSSIMGATKRVAELVIQSLDPRYPTHFVAVRFGNVLGSAGSVIPIFREQIANGGPLTVTHPEMTRYFMTITEAAQLVLQAGAMGRDREIFVLDMGEPVRILDLALDMITLSGLRPFDDIEIVFSGIRRGEKLTEELALSDEQLAKTRHPKIFIGKLTPYPPEIVQEAVQSLSKLVDSGPRESIRAFLEKLLPEANLEPQTVEHATLRVEQAYLD